MECVAGHAGNENQQNTVQDGAIYPCLSLLLHLSALGLNFHNAQPDRDGVGLDNTTSELSFPSTKSTLSLRTPPSMPSVPGAVTHAALAGIYLAGIPAAAMCVKARLADHTLSVRLPIILSSLCTQRSVCSTHIQHSG